MSYHDLDLYTHNKNNYLRLNNRHQIGGYNKYLLVHWTDFENLLQILKDNTLHANKYLDKKHVRLSGDNITKYIYTNLITKCQTVDNFGVAIILNKQLLLDNTFIFNQGWISIPNKDSIIVYPNDSKSIRNDKMNKIIHIINNTRPILDHEILFEDNIDLNKYIKGIYFPNCDENDEMINEILKINKNIKFYNKFI